VECEQRGEHEKKRQPAFGKSAHRQPAVAPKPLQVKAASELEQNQSRLSSSDASSMSSALGPSSRPAAT
jgi:hypothetical protein